MLTLLNFFGLTTIRQADRDMRVLQDEFATAHALASEMADAALSVLAKPIATGESRKALKQAVDDFRFRYEWGGEF